MQPPFQARTHALRMRSIHLMHRYLSLATPILARRLIRCQCPMRPAEAAPADRRGRACGDDGVRRELPVQGGGKRWQVFLSAAAAVHTGDAPVVSDRPRERWPVDSDHLWLPMPIAA